MIGAPKPFVVSIQITRMMTRAEGYRADASLMTPWKHHRVVAEGGLEAAMLEAAEGLVELLADLKMTTVDVEVRVQIGSTTHFDIPLSDFENRAEPQNQFEKLLKSMKVVCRA